MKITVLNGNPDANKATFDEYLTNLAGELVSSGHELTTFELRAMDIRYCIGCLDCWVKSPGQCQAADESHEVCCAAINSDLVVWASPVIMGFYSALLKKVTDKFIGLVHPYAVFVQGETHHRARYDKYPLGGLLLEKSDDTDDDDIKFISDIHGRTLLNFKSSLSFTKLTLDSVEEVAREIDRL